MKLTEQQKLQIARNLEKVDMKCPICGSRNFRIPSDIHALPNIVTEPGEKDDIILTIVIACKECWNIQFFSAQGLGIIGAVNFKP